MTTTTEYRTVRVKGDNIHHLPGGHPLRDNPDGVRTFRAYDHDGLVRLIAPTQEDVPGGHGYGFYERDTDPEGFYGWNIDKSCVESVEEEVPKPGSPQSVGLHIVQVKPTYKSWPDNHPFRLSPLTENVPYWAHMLSDGTYRIVTPHDNEGAGFGFYDHDQDPEGWKGWTLSPKYIDDSQSQVTEDEIVASTPPEFVAQPAIPEGTVVEINEQNQITAKIAREPGTGIPSEIRCHRGMRADGDYDRCKVEAAWNVRFRTPACGIADKRTNNHHYCSDHMLSMMKNIYSGNTHYCLDADCDSDAHKMYWEDLISIEQL